MPDREEKHSILTAHPAEIAREQGLFAALDALKQLTNATFSTEELAHQLTARIRSALKVQCTALWLLDDQRETISLRAYSCVNHIELLPKNYFYRLDKTSPLGECIQKAKPSLHKKYVLAENDPRMEVLAKPLSAALLPLLAPKGTLGVLEILTAAEDAIDKDELEALESISAQVTLLLLSNQSGDRLTRQSELQQKLYEITGKLNHAKDYESILKITVEELCSALNLPAASMHVNMTAAISKPVSTKERH